MSNKSPWLHIVNIVNAEYKAESDDPISHGISISSNFMYGRCLMLMCRGTYAHRTFSGACVKRNRFPENMTVVDRLFLSHEFIDKISTEVHLWALAIKCGCLKVALPLSSYSMHFI